MFAFCAGDEKTNRCCALTLVQGLVWGVSCLVVWGTGKLPLAQRVGSERLRRLRRPRGQLGADPGPRGCSRCLGPNESGLPFAWSLGAPWLAHGLEETPRIKPPLAHVTPREANGLKPICQRINLGFPDGITKS